MTLLPMLQPTEPGQHSSGKGALVAVPVSALVRALRRVILSWQVWRSKRAIYRAYPEIRYFDDAIAQARKQHRTVKHLEAARRDSMTAALRGRLAPKREAA